MEWTEEAKGTLNRVPFFVRKRVKKRIEEEACRCRAEKVTLEHVRTCKKRFLEKMEDEVKGFQVESCFGSNGCPNRVVNRDDLRSELEKRLTRRNLKAYLKTKVNGPLKLHHEFRISFSDCPNACSQPQIADIGIIGARRPRVSEKTCSKCGACADTCREHAISLSDKEDAPVIDFDKCLSCGKCITVCPTGTLEENLTGYRILLGGKLGRHPRLGTELPGIYGFKETLRVVDLCLDHYQRYCTAGERFAEVLELEESGLFKTSLGKNLKKKG